MDEWPKDVTVAGEDHDMDRESFARDARVAGENGEIDRATVRTILSDREALARKDRAPSSSKDAEYPSAASTASEASGIGWLEENANKPSSPSLWQQTPGHPGALPSCSASPDSLRRSASADNVGSHADSDESWTPDVAGGRYCSGEHFPRLSTLTELEKTGHPGVVRSSSCPPLMLAETPAVLPAEDVRTDVLRPEFGAISSIHDLFTSLAQQFCDRASNTTAPPFPRQKSPMYRWHPNHARTRPPVASYAQRKPRGVGFDLVSYILVEAEPYDSTGASNTVEDSSRFTKKQSALVKLVNHEPTGDPSARSAEIVERSMLPGVVTTLRQEIDCDGHTVVTDQNGRGGIIPDEHLILLERLQQAAHLCNVPFTIIDRPSSTRPQFRPGDTIDILPNSPIVRQLVGVVDGTPAACSPWKKLSEYLTQIATVISVDSSTHQTVEVRQCDGIKCRWPYAVCIPVFDQVLEDALEAVNLLGLRKPEEWKRAIRSGRGDKIYTPSRLRAAVLGLPDRCSASSVLFTWHNKQRLLDAVAKLDAQRKLRESPTGYRPPDSRLRPVIENLLSLERGRNRLGQASVLLRATEEYSGHILPFSYRHYLLTSVGCTPGIWQWSPFFHDVEAAGVRLDIAALLSGAFNADSCTSDSLITDPAATDQRGSIPLVFWTLSEARALRKLPKEVKREISSYLLPVTTIQVLEDMLQQSHDECDGADLAVEVYQLALERCSTVHDSSIAQGCLSLIHKDYTSAQGHFKRAMLCHKHRDAKPDLPRETPYASMLAGIITNPEFGSAASVDDSLYFEQPDSYPSYYYEGSFLDFPPFAESNGYPPAAPTDNYAPQPFSPYGGLTSGTPPFFNLPVDIALSILYGGSPPSVLGGYGSNGILGEMAGLTGNVGHVSLASLWSGSPQSSAHSPPPLPSLAGLTGSASSASWGAGDDASFSLGDILASAAAAVSPPASPPPPHTPPEGVHTPLSPPIPPEYYSTSTPGTSTEPPSTPPPPSSPPPYQPPDVSPGVDPHPDSNVPLSSECHCGRDDDDAYRADPSVPATKDLSYVKMLAGLIKPDETYGGCPLSFSKEARWISRLASLQTDSSPPPLDVDSDCVTCLYHMALCVPLATGIRLLEKARALYHEARFQSATRPTETNSCPFMHGQVELLLGMYYIASRRYADARSSFSVAADRLGSAIATAWLAKLDIREDRKHGKATARRRLAQAMALYPPKKAGEMLTARAQAARKGVSLWYCDYARLAQGMACINFSFDDLNAALVRSPKRSALYQLSAGILQDTGKKSAACVALSKSIRYTFQSSDLLQRARIRLSEGKLKEAARDLSASLLFRPSNQQAELLLKDCKHLLPTDPDVLLNIFYSRTGYVTKAACLYQWLTIQPHHPHIFCRISQFFFRLGHKRNVHNYWCMQAVKNCPPEWAPLFNGLLAESARDFEAAAMLFKEAVRNLPLEYECHVMLAYTLVSLNRYEDSTKVLRCALHLASHPSHCSIVYNNIGYNYRCCRMLHRALFYFDKSKEFMQHLHYSFFNPYSNASEIYLMLGDEQKAVDEIHAGLKNAIELRPSMLEELLTKGCFASMEEVFGLCSHIKYLDPYNDFSYRYGAATLWDIGRLDAGLEELDDGIELTIGTHALVMRGEVMYIRHMKSSAEENVAMALLLDPHNEPALRLYSTCIRRA
ncbi:hypothetical protein DIPPA_32827 [Diplonema papillatum]|nr:hypothetical protein DIPPA_32827 [Diplonema papillatum]